MFLKAKKGDKQSGSKGSKHGGFALPSLTGPRLHYQKGRAKDDTDAVHDVGVSEMDNFV